MLARAKRQATDGDLMDNVFGERVAGDQSRYASLEEVRRLYRLKKLL